MWKSSKNADIKFFNPWNIVDGRNPTPVEAGNLSQYLQGFYTSQVVTVAGFLKHQRIHPKGLHWNSFWRSTLRLTKELQLQMFSSQLSDVQNAESDNNIGLFDIILLKD